MPEHATPIQLDRALYTFDVAGVHKIRSLSIDDEHACQPHEAIYSRMRFDSGSEHTILLAAGPGLPVPPAVLDGR